MRHKEGFALLSRSSLCHSSRVFFFRAQARPLFPLLGSVASGSALLSILVLLFGTHLSPMLALFGSVAISPRTSSVVVGRVISRSKLRISPFASATVVVMVMMMMMTMVSSSFHLLLFPNGHLLLRLASVLLCLLLDRLNLLQFFLRLSDCLTFFEKRK